MATMFDAAFAAKIPSSPAIVAGYLTSPNAYHPWSGSDWGLFRHIKKLPVWVAANGPKNGKQDAWAALEQLYDLGATPGCYVALDMETSVDKSYVENFGAVMTFAGFKTWVYGSASTVFENPSINGYWVASYTGSPYMYKHSSVRATQYSSNNDFDSSQVKTWTVLTGKWWI